MRFDLLYAFTGWASGPDTIAGLLWAPAIFALATSDQTCGSVAGISSGADGQRCTTFNETHFLSLNGSSCVASDALFDQPRYTHDPSLPGCASAMAAYRAETGFTCDCNGDFAFLGGTGGLRAGTVFNLASSIAIAIVALLAPALGTWIDFKGGKKLWWAFVLTAGFSMLGQAVLAPNYIWLIGLAISMLTAIATECATIPRSAYLTDVRASTAGAGETPTQAAARVAGWRTMLSYASQILFIVLALGVSFATPSPVHQGMIITGLAGAWYLGFMSFAVRKFHAREASRGYEGGRLSSRGVCAEGIKSYGVLLRDLRDLRAHYPEALKYLAFLFVAQNGLGLTVLSIANSYLIDQLAFSGLQTQLMFAIVLVMGLPWTWLFTKVSRCASYKVLLAIVVLINAAAILAIGLVFRSPVNGVFGAAYYQFLGVAAVLVTPGLCWWFSLYWPAFMTLVPEERVNQFSGLFTFVRTFASIWQAGPIYVSLTTAFDSANTGRQVGLLSMLAWDALALPLLLWIDFRKGREQAGRCEDAPAVSHTRKAVEVDLSAAEARSLPQRCTTSV